MADDAIQYKLTLDADQFKVVVGEVGRAVREMQGQFTRTAATSKELDAHIHGIGSSFRRFIITVGAARFALMDIHDVFLRLPAAILKTTGEFERMGKLMEGLSNQTTDFAKKMDAASNVDFLRNIALRAPFDIKNLSDSFVRLKAAGLDPTNGSFQALVDSVARFGGSSEQLQRASVAISQMAGKGVISMEELRQQLGEAVPDAMKIMAQSMGVTMKELTDNVSKGIVTAEPALERMFLLMAIKNRNAAQEMMDTWTGLTQQLKTRFDMAMNDIGQSGFMKEVSNQVRRVLELFDTTEFKNVGRSIGEGLVTAVQAFAKIAESVIKNFNEIATAAKTIAAIWAVDKIFTWGQNSVTAIRATLAERMKLRQREIDDARVQAASLELSRKEQLRVLAEQRAAIEQKSIQTSRDLMNTLAAIEAETAARRAAIAEIRALEIAATAAKREQNIANSMLGGMDSSDAYLRAQSQVVYAQRKEAADKNIVSMNAQAQAQRRLIESTTEGILLNRRATEGVMAASAAASTAANSIGLMGRAMSGLRTAFLAMGGWLGMITLALQAGILLWMNWGNAAEEAIDRKRRAERNSSTEEDEKYLSKEKKRLEARVQDYKDSMAEMEKDGLTTSPRYVGLKANLKLAEAELQKVVAEYVAVSKQVKERVANDLASGLMGTLENEANVVERAASAKFVERIKELSQKAKDATGAAKKQAEKDLIGVQNEQAKAASAARTEFLRSKFTEQAIELADLIKKGEGDGQKAQRLIITQKRLGELLRGAATETNRANEILGTNVKGDPKTPNQKPEQPLVRAVEAIKADADLAKARLEAVVQDVRGLAQFEREAAIQVIGDLASGKFDYQLSEKGEDGESLRKYLGGEKERKKFLDALREDIRKGNTDIAAFIQGLGGIDDKTKALLTTLVRSTAQKNRDIDATQGLQQAQGQLASTSEQLQSAMETLSVEGMAKAGTSLLATERYFARLEARLKDSVREFAEFNRIKNLALAMSAATDTSKYITSESEKGRETQREYLSGVMTQTQARDYAHKQTLNQIDSEYKLQKKTWTELRDGFVEGSQERAAAETVLMGIEQTAANARTRALMKYRIDSRTELDRLKSDWYDVTQQMNQATARWASNIVDSLVNSAMTGKLEWKKIISSMLSDTLRIMMQEQLAKPLTDMMKGLGDWMTKTLGLGKTAAAETAAQQQIAAQLQLISTSSVLNGAFTVLMNSANAASAALNTIIAAAGASSSSGFISFPGLPTIPSSGVADSVTMPGLFANGGIMTDMGPLALRKYASGGIAKNPQVAIYGEGAMAEAYVPLPDGRTIPVTMDGGGAPNVQVNVINQTGQAVNANQSQPRFDGRQMVLDVVLTAINQPGGFRDGMKGAMGR